MMLLPFLKAAIQQQDLQQLKKRQVLRERDCSGSMLLPARRCLAYVLDAGIHVHAQPEAPAVHICIATAFKKEVYFPARGRR